MQNEKMTIGEVAALAGVETSTLRYYESIGLLPAPPRQSGRRYYNPDILPVLAIIKLAKEVNFSLPEIRELLYGYADELAHPSERWHRLAAQKLVEVNAMLASVLEMKHLLEESLSSDSLQHELDMCPLLRHHQAP